MINTPDYDGIGEQEQIEDQIQFLKCRWKQDSDGNWETDCDNLFTFFDGGPTNNGFRYCPYCSKQINEIGRESELD